MDYIFLVITNEGDRGVGMTVDDAIKIALNAKEYFQYREVMELHGRSFKWSAYVPQSLNEKAAKQSRLAPVIRHPLRYESCIVSLQDEPLFEVYRTPSPEAIKRLVAKYGYTKQSARVPFAVNAIVKRIPSKSEGQSKGTGGKTRTPPRRVD